MTAPPTIKPKTETQTYKGQRITLTFNPAEPVAAKAWSWHARITQTYDFTGTAVSLSRARLQAQAKINELLNLSEVVG